MLVAYRLTKECCPFAWPSSICARWPAPRARATNVEVYLWRQQQSSRGLPLLRTHLQYTHTHTNENCKWQRFRWIAIETIACRTSEAETRKQSEVRQASPDPFSNSNQHSRKYCRHKLARLDSARHESSPSTYRTIFSLSLKTK